MTPYVEPCPFCGAKAVDVTVTTDRIPRFICTGDECHEWQEGDQPETPVVAAETEDGEDIAAEILEALTEIKSRLSALESEFQQFKARPSWVRRLLTRA